MVNEGVITVNNKRFGTYQYDIIRRPYNAINDTHSEEWGWKFVEFTGKVAVCDNLAFADNVCFRLIELNDNV